ncbi:GNAT family N-acetyltransferase [Streptomyces sp. MUM 203J]|uniref:GNAT family N-acetyltransferase n=1 Tax=Streptomyces sp. MUM 203J TaxID=2791990 RepID=UPI001F04E39A|nr:amino acid acetyltransferase [Streptomyces sp. MUM 203J]
MPRPAVLLPSTPPAPPFTVRPAGPEDADALAALSRPFVRSGALRERPPSLYAAQAADFLVAEAPDGTLDGCLGLGVHRAGQPGGRTAGVVYNFCVGLHRQGSGTGARLLDAALGRARTCSLDTLFTATTGSGRLFLRYGFTPAAAGDAPAAWARSLDPRRNARVLALSL